MARHCWILTAGILTALSAAPAAAQDAPATPAPPAVTPAPPAPKSPVTCTSAGNTYQLGDYACLPACHGRRRLARCDAVGQAGSWTYVSNACPSAMINTPWPASWTQLPVATAMTPIPVSVHMSAIDPGIAPLVGSHYRESVLTR
jgi:hypothetical protein